MGIRFACHECGKRLNIKAELAGRRGVCPVCSAKIRIPLDDAETSTPPDPRPGNPQFGNPQPGGRAARVESETVSSAGFAGLSAVEERTSVNVAEDAIASSAKSAGMVSGSDRSLLSEHEPEAIWYVRPPSGGQYGPASTDLLRQWIEEGRVAASSLLWRDGWPQWRNAGEMLPELSGRLPDDLVTEAFDPSPSKIAVQPGFAVEDSRTTPASPSQSATSWSGMSGDESIGTKRRVRSSRRVLWIGLLSAIAILLVGVLLVVVNL